MIHLDFLASPTFRIESVIRVHLCPFVVSLQRVTLFFLWELLGNVGKSWEMLGISTTYDEITITTFNRAVWNQEPTNLVSRPARARRNACDAHLQNRQRPQHAPTHPASPSHMAANTHLIPSVSPAHRRDSKSDVSLPGELRLCQRSSQDKNNASPFVVKLFINYLCYQKAPESHNIAQIRVWQAPKARNIGRTMPIG